MQGINHQSYFISKTLAREKLAAKLLYDYNLGSTKQTSGNFNFVKLDCSWLSVLVNQDTIFSESLPYNPFAEGYGLI